MPETPSPSGPGPQWTGLEVTPVLPEDPAKIGGYWLDGRVAARPSGVAYLAHGDGVADPNGTTPAPEDQRIILVQLAEGAAADSSARDRFGGLVNKLHIDRVVARGGQDQDEGRLGRRFRATNHHPVDPEDAAPLAPWVALAYEDDPSIVATAEHLLAEVDLLDLPPQGRVAGPDFRLHWIDRTAPGRNRIWPLPWPGRYDRAGWVSILMSWLLMMLLAAIAVLIAILIFHDSPPQSPPPQAETSAATPPPSEPQSADPSSASPTPEESPSPTSGSPSPETGSPTPEPSGSAQGTPTPPSRL